MQRREYIAVTGMAAGALLAGCVSDGPSGDPVSIGDASTDSVMGTPTESVTDTDSSTSAPREDLVDIRRESAATYTFGSVLEMREFGWIDRELHYGTRGAAGVVENVSNQRLRQASLAVDFYDEDTQIGTNTSWFDFIEPGEYGMFEVPYTGEEPERVTRIVVSASVQVKPLVPLNAGQVTVSDDGLDENEDGWPILTGTVENIINDRLARVMLFVNFYREQELLGWGRDAVPRLGPDENAQWTALTDRANAEDITRYSVVATVRE